jgi:hypothetical protein
MQAIRRVDPDILLAWEEDDPTTDIHPQVAVAVSKVIALGSNARVRKQPKSMMTWYAQRTP